jgi:hypothetical protein
MTKDLWLTDEEVKGIAEKNSAWIKRQQTVSYLAPAVIDPDTLWGAHLDMLPADLEKKIIDAVTSDPELLERIDGVNIHYNAKAYPNREGGESLNFLILAYKGEGPVHGENQVKCTTELLKVLDLQDRFAPYKINYWNKDAATAIAHCRHHKKSLEKIEYQTQTLTLRLSD